MKTDCGRRTEERRAAGFRGDSYGDRLSDTGRLVWKQVDGYGAAGGAMKETFDLQDYLIRGVERVVAGAMKATLKDPRESAYMIRFAAASKVASKRRKSLEKEGLHVPPFLIASITSACNLHCAGCYSRCNEATTDDEPARRSVARDI